ncbi:Glycogenin-1 [Labeo rohita]|uniref:glycogenin glucosyltransferase n=1 Tax=Labeo rohita TaxID=84645 RepID=A0ABQ8LEZ1_LABRO|nr:Glycogenin-1 [Labeo rohita]
MKPRPRYHEPIVAVSAEPFLVTCLSAVYMEKVCAAEQAFVTLATNDSYARGAMVLGKSLRNHKTSKKLVVLVGPHVSDQSRAVLHKIFDEVRLVDVLDSGDTAHLAMMKRPDLGVTFTKLHCWTLTHYSKCVFMDADTLVVSNIDELFDREELSAAPDPGWPDCFNSGVFVFRPSNETYGKLLQYCTEHGSFDGAKAIFLQPPLGQCARYATFMAPRHSEPILMSLAVSLSVSIEEPIRLLRCEGGDQGVLNGFFSDWATADINKHLPFIYNMSSIAIYTYLPAFKQYGANAKVVHFLGQMKPWSYTYNLTQRTLRGDVQASSQPGFLLQWWALYSAEVLPMLVREYGDQPFISGCEEDAAASEEHVQPLMSSAERKQRWEQGQADYMGIDSFDNIQKKLDVFLK